ncbi:MAG TPA: nucleotidyl transferase AbiEii/AbiGii toxin family protein [Cyclobacteriaceae bacterium]|jgi:hypothetical protein|nr:nucleotidyl transferase AbiEii/AbiGii toxin family protein [Cyclobacteriaceae bacterium]
MRDWIHKTERERIDLLRLVASQASLPDYMIEKDWWVTTTLECIFTSELQSHFAFKGGTSLSKCWNILNRFSEDIDIVIDKTLFGVQEVEEVGRGKRGKLRKDAHKFIVEVVVPKLNERMLTMGVPPDIFQLYADTSTSSDQDPTVILLDYKSITQITNGYTKAQVKIEIGVRALMEPSEKKSVNSLLAEHLRITESVDINTVLPQRTFWEKVFLLHELFQQPEEKMDISRMSRHWYDLNQLSQAGYAKKAMEDQGLYEAIRNHRKIFTKVSEVDYDNLSPQNFSLFPSEKKESDWQSDYNKMMESYIYRNAPSLKELKDSIKKIEDDFSKLRY